MARPIYEIAAEVRKDWKKVYFGAVPYLDAMGSLDKITDNYFEDSGKSVVLYFLANAQSWRGEKAKAIKNGSDDEETAMKAMQRVINDGQGWKMQGSMGRSMMAALEAGQCMLGKTATADYYGNAIPSRDQVKAGTKGSYEYVADAMGTEWADMMKEL